MQRKRHMWPARSHLFAAIKAAVLNSRIAVRLKSCNNFSNLKQLMAALLHVLLLAFLVLLQQQLPVACGIINDHPETSNANRLLRVDPQRWNVGIQCLDKIARTYFQRPEHYTRSYNMVATAAFNMSTPAAQIMNGYLKLINEAVSGDRWDKLQLRVVANNRPYDRLSIVTKDLVYADFYLMIVDSVSLLKLLLKDFVSQMPSFNPGGHFLVLYNNASHRVSESEVAYEVFEELQNVYYVQRVGLLYATDDTAYNFSIMNYYTNSACRSIRQQQIATCRSGVTNVLHNYAQLLDAVHAQTRSINMQNCTLYVCASVSAPFVANDCIEGIEMSMLRFFKNRFGFKLNISCSQESRGVLDEKTEGWTGLLRELTDRHCDFIFGGFYPDNEVQAVFWTSECYLYDTHTWFVKLAEVRPPWQALYSIFESTIWYGIMITLLLSWLVWYLLTKSLPEPKSHGNLPLLGINTLGVTICASVYERPICHASRIFFISLTLYGLNIVCLYTSNLIAIFTEPGYLDQIDQLKEVVAAGIPFGGYEECRDWFENDDDMWIYNAYNTSFLFEPHTENLEAVKLGQRVILSSRMYILQNNLSDQIAPFSKNVFSSPLQMIMKPGFPFMNDINWLIRFMRDAGILEKIDKDFRYNNTYLNRVAKMRPIFKESAVVLTTEHLEGPFAILIIGCLCATLAFLGERLVPTILPYLKRHREERKRHKHKGNVQEKSRRQAPKVRTRAKPRRSKLNAEPGRTDADDAPTYPIGVLRSVRFTPIKRRRVLFP